MLLSIVCTSLRNWVLLYCLFKTLCFTFKSIIYGIQSVVLSIFIAFICAYLALWIDLLLTIIAEKYEEIYESLGAEESEDSDGKQRGKDHQRKEE